MGEGELTPAQRIRLLELAEKIARDYEEDDTLEDRLIAIEFVFEGLVEQALGNVDTERDAFDEDIPSSADEQNAAL